MSSQFTIRKFLTQVQESHEEMGQPVDPPVRKVIVAAVLSNPYAGRYVEDLSEAVEYSVGLGRTLAERAMAVLGDPVASYGKGGMAGVAGEQEHVVMLKTTPFGNAIRETIGGGQAWISSTSRVGSAGTPLTIPLAHKDALTVRDQYDAVTLYTDDAPRPDEIVLGLAVANRGRPLARMGGLKAEDVTGEDGLT